MAKSENVLRRALTPKLVGVVVLIISLFLTTLAVLNNNFGILSQARRLSNNAPTITPNRLPKGKVSKTYETQFTISDLNKNDYVTVWFTEIPPNFYPSCYSPTRLNSYHKCILIGTPKSVGIFNFTVNASDAKNTTTKTYTISIVK